MSRPAGRASRRGAKVRFPIVEDPPAGPDPVPSLGPLVFWLRFDGHQVRYDLSDLPCPRLVRPLAQALAELGGEDGARRTRAGFGTILRAVRDFVTFIGAAEPEGPSGSPWQTSNRGCWTRSRPRWCATTGGPAAAHPR
jgi:hypothetical protein